MHTRVKILAAATTVLATVALPAAAASAKPAPAPSYYVNLGDSYAMGYQPGFASGSETLHGYANKLVPLLSSKVKLTLENFGCGGATTNSILNSVSCPGLANNGVAYPTTTQAAAAVAFIAAHPGQTKLITISIGGNDFDGCIAAADAATCVANSLPKMQANITTLVADLRAVAPMVPIEAITYPDVALGAWLKGTAGQALAKLSVFAFSALINPTFVKAYSPGHVAFVDITAKTGAYGPLSKLTTLKPYGKIPVPVAQVCTLTWFCQKGDIHPKDAGYTLIAQQLAANYAKAVTLAATA